MNKTISEAVDFVRQVEGKVNSDVEALVCVPFTALYEVKKAIEGTGLKLGAQNMHWKDSGAFTGEVSPLMLKEIGVDYVVIGHSERREYFAETDETVNKKVKKALSVGIRPIMCVGETLEEREAGKAEIKIGDQILEGLKGIEPAAISEVVVAYEPIWAIGTGKTATSDQANDMIAFIRKTVRDLFGDAAEELRIQYGGSVKKDNVSELMGKSDLDGALVGGASLEPADFECLINYKKEV